MKHCLPFILLLALLCAACHDDSSPKHIEGDLSLDLQGAGWTFVSLETGIILGTCALDDTLTLNDYAQRTDWDVAFSSEGHLRTNSGLSGNGQGGISTSSAPFGAADVVPEEEYLADTAHYELW